MSMVLDKEGNIVTKSNFAPHDPSEDVVTRMHVLIGLIQQQDPDCHDPHQNAVALEMLKEMLPTKEQVAVYINPLKQ
jgi:hypothetical protein